MMLFLPDLGTMHINNHRAILEEETLMLFGSGYFREWQVGHGPVNIKHLYHRSQPFEICRERNTWVISGPTPFSLVVRCFTEYPNWQDETAYWIDVKTGEFNPKGALPSAYLERPHDYNPGMVDATNETLFPVSPAYWKMKCIHFRTLGALIFFMKHFNALPGRNR